MKANELKANNHLTFTTATNKEVVVKIMGAIDEDGGRVFFHGSQYRDGGQNEPLSYAIARFKPIPLTEEILLKAGFIRHQLLRDNKAAVLFSLNEFSLIEVQGGYYACVVGYDDPFGKEIFEYGELIEYVHDLQNGYYWHTKKEIEINL